MVIDSYRHGYRRSRWKPGAETCVTGSDARVSVTVASQLLRRLAACALRLYKIMLHDKVLSWESIVLLLTPPPEKYTLLQYYCTTIAQYTPPPTAPSFECHTLYNIGVGNIV